MGDSGIEAAADGCLGLLVGLVIVVVVLLAAAWWFGVRVSIQ